MNQRIQDDSIENSPRVESTTIFLENEQLKKANDLIMLSKKSDEEDFQTLQ